MSPKPFHITKTMHKAGILYVNPLPNANGSYTALVRLDLIEMKSVGINFREFDQSHSNEIQARFNKHAVRNPRLIWDKELQRLNGNNGQHTVDALIALGYTEWTCDIYFNLNVMQAAAVFVEDTQNNKRMEPFDAHAAALVAQYRKHLEIQEDLDQSKFTTPNTPGCNNNSADLKNFTPIEEAYNNGRALLRTFLKVMRTWKAPGFQLDEVARQNAFQRGLLDFLKANVEYCSDATLVAMFKPLSTNDITRRAKWYSKERINRNHYLLALNSLLVPVQYRIAA